VPRSDPLCPEETGTNGGLSPQALKGCRGVAVGDRWRVRSLARSLLNPLA